MHQKAENNLSHPNVSFDDFEKERNIAMSEHTLLSSEFDQLNEVSDQFEQERLE